MDSSARPTSKRSVSQSRRKVTRQQITTALEIHPATSSPNSGLSPQSWHQTLTEVLERLTVGSYQETESTGLKDPPPAIEVKSLGHTHTLESLTSMVEDLRSEVENYRSEVKELSKEQRVQKSENKKINDRLSLTIRSIDGMICQSAMLHGALYELAAITFITAHMRTLKIRRNSSSQKRLKGKGSAAGVSKEEGEDKTSQRIIDDFLDETGLNQTNDKHDAFNTSLQDSDFSIYTILSRHESKFRTIANNLRSKRIKDRNEAAHPTVPINILYNLLLLERWAGQPYSKELSSTEEISGISSRYPELAQYHALIDFFMLCLPQRDRQQFFTQLCESTDFFPMKKWQRKFHRSAAGYWDTLPVPWIRWDDED